MLAVAKVLPDRGVVKIQYIMARPHELEDPALIANAYLPAR
jgi:hypothetical protein